MSQMIISLCKKENRWRFADVRIHEWLGNRLVGETEKCHNWCTYMSVKGTNLIYRHIVNSRKYLFHFTKSRIMTDETKCDTANGTSEKKPAFGNRLLSDPKDVFEHNAWDHVVWDTEQKEYAEKKTKEQLAEALPPDKLDHYEEEASNYWDKFYQTHQDGFFKDRHWLFTEFPELEKNITDKNPQDTSRSVDGQDQSSVDFPGCQASYRVLEVGCGAGNTVFPVLQTNRDQGLMVYCCDFSQTAVDLVKKHPDYNSERCHAFVCDVTDDSCKVPFPNNSLDVIVLIFVLSAVNPDKMQYVINRLSQFLKPGGIILFRDYGRYDMAQLRFKKGHCLSENFYVRGDGTRVYYFTREELKSMFEKAGLEEVQNIIDSRLQVNRGRQLKMYRVWVQCKYRKTLLKSTENNDTDGV